MKIGIIGSGNIGGTLAIKWGKAGHDVILASRNPSSLAAIAEQSGPAARTGKPEDAAASADIVLVATPFKAWPDLAAALGPSLAGKIVIDATNVYPERDGEIARRAIETGEGSGAFVQKLLPAAHVVKAFNTLYFKVLAEQGGQGLGLAIAGNNRTALSAVASLVKDAGFEPVVAGEIGRSKCFDPGTAVYAKALTEAELAAALGITHTKP